MSPPLVPSGSTPFTPLLPTPRSPSSPTSAPLTAFLHLTFAPTSALTFALTFALTVTSLSSPPLAALWLLHPPHCSSSSWTSTWTAILRDPSWLLSLRLAPPFFSSVLVSLSLLRFLSPSLSVMASVAAVSAAAGVGSLRERRFTSPLTYNPDPVSDGTFAGPTTSATSTPSPSPSTNDSAASTSTPGLSFTPPPSISLSASLSASAAFVLSLCVYVSSCFPSVAGGDSGGVVLASCELSVEHPPGYPLIVMLTAATIRLAQLWDHSVSPAYAANLLSCVLGAAAAAGVADCAHGLCKAALTWVGAVESRHRAVLPQLLLPVAATMGGLSYALLPTVWLYSTQAEVFALNNALTAALCCLLLRFFFALDAADRATALSQRDAVRSLIRLVQAGAVLCGLMMSNQHTSALLILPIGAAIAWLLWRSPAHRSIGLISPRLILSVAALGVLGLSPYLYMVVRAFSFPRHTWGDQRTLEGFLTHLLRSEYGTFRLAKVDDEDESPNPGMLARSMAYLQVFMTDGSYVVPFLAVWGVLSGLCQSRVLWARRMAAVQLLAFAVYMLVWNHLANLPLTAFELGIQERFWMQPNLLLTMWAAAGLVSVIHFILDEGAMDGSGQSQSQSQSVNFSMMGRGALLLAVAVPMGQLALHWHEMDHSASMSFHTSAVRLLESLPRSPSLVLLNGDWQHGAVRYAQSCEGVRPDVLLLSEHLVHYPWFARMQRRHYPRVVLHDDISALHQNESSHTTTVASNSTSFTAHHDLQRLVAANLAAGFTVVHCEPNDYWQHVDRHRMAWSKDSQRLDVQYLNPSSPYSHIRLPYGSGCVQFVEMDGSEPLKLLALIARSDEAAALHLDELQRIGLGDPQRDTPDTWEHYWYHTILDGHARLLTTVHALLTRAHVLQTDEGVHRTPPGGDDNAVVRAMDFAVFITQRLLRQPYLVVEMLQRHLLTSDSFDAMAAILRQQLRRIEGGGTRASEEDISEIHVQLRETQLRGKELRHYESALLTPTFSINGTVIDLLNTTSDTRISTQLASPPLVVRSEDIPHTSLDK